MCSFPRAWLWREKGRLVPSIKGLLSGKPRDQKSQRKTPCALFTPPQHQEADPPDAMGKGPGICPIPTSLLPTFDDQVLQGGPGIGQAPLLACFLERGRDPILVGQDLAVLEGSRHF